MKKTKTILLFGLLLTVGVAWFGYSHLSTSSVVSGDHADKHESKNQRASGGIQTDGPKLSTPNVKPLSRLQERNIGATNEIENDDPASLRAYFREDKNCYDLHIIMSSAENALVECEALAGTRGYKDCSGDVGRLEEEIRDTRSRSVNCPTDALELARAYYDSTKSAARAGDADARLCYMQSSYAAKYTYKFRPVFPYTEQDKLDYLNDVPLYIEDALARGDWRIVQLFATHHAGGLMSLVFRSDSGVVQLLVAHAGSIASRNALGDPSIIYVMNRLLRLGATGEYAKVLDLTADDYENGERIDGSGERGRISPDQVYESKAWAQRMYDQYFSKSPQLTEAPWPCRSERK